MSKLFIETYLNDDELEAGFNELQRTNPKVYQDLISTHDDVLSMIIKAAKQELEAQPAKPTPQQISGVFAKYASPAAKWQLQRQQLQYPSKGAPNTFQKEAEHANTQNVRQQLNTFDQTISDAFKRSIPLPEKLVNLLELRGLNKNWVADNIKYIVAAAQSYPFYRAGNVIRSNPSFPEYSFRRDLEDWVKSKDNQWKKADQTNQQINAVRQKARGLA